MADLKDVVAHVEDIDDDSLSAQKNTPLPAITGTVTLTSGHEGIIYIPTPTSDPQDPLNMAPWHKAVFIIIISLFSTVGLSLVSGFGGLLGFYIPGYVAIGKDYADITHLMTFPALFMGIGNLIGMPIAYGVGRRIVFLGSCIVLVIAAVLCAIAPSYEFHLAARMVLGLAAGQSEALVPMMTQEIYFLHERGKCLMVQTAVQSIATAVFTLFASPIASAIKPRNWYLLGAGLTAVVFVLAIFLLPETKYERPIEAFQSTASHGAVDLEKVMSRPVICTSRPPLDLSRHQPRTWKSDMRLWVGKPSLKETLKVYKDIAAVFFFPQVMWAMLLNGLTLGINIAIGTTYGSILGAAPYNWPNSSVSYANAGQIATALVALPMLGFASDWIIKKMAARNEGVHEPENRLLTLIFPIVVGVFTAVLYGQAAQYPGQYHWFTFVWALAAYYFCFLGANICAITVLIDSYPARAGPLLVIICAFRGVISFGTSYGTVPFIASAGYSGAFGAFAGLTGGLALFGIPIFFYGKRIRQFTGRFVKDEKTH